MACSALKNITLNTIAAAGTIDNIKTGIRLNLKELPKKLLSLPIMIVSIKHLLYVNLTCDWRLFSKFIFFTKFSSVSICFFLTSTSARLKICSFYTHETSSKQKKLLKYWDMGLTTEQCWTGKLLWFVPELIAQGVKSAASSRL